MKGLKVLSLYSLKILGQREPWRTHFPWRAWFLSGSTPLHLRVDHCFAGMPWASGLVCYCCVTSSYKPSGWKSHTCITSQFPWVRSPRSRVLCPGSHNAEKSSCCLVQFSSEFPCPDGFGGRALFSSWLLDGACSYPLEAACSSCFTVPSLSSSQHGSLLLQS